MELFLDIAQGAGLAAAAGIRPFLPVLLVGALASANVGIDFGGTDYAFLESPAFLLGVVAALVAFVVALRRLGPERLEAGPLGAAFAGLTLGLGALLFAGALADGGHTWWPGLIAGLACALLAQSATRSIFIRTLRRLDAAARAALPIYFEAVALAVAAVAVLVPPVSLLALASLVWLLVAGRRREGQKYAGLRILR
jgi:hypothetical protein